MDPLDSPVGPPANHSPVTLYLDAKLPWPQQSVQCISASQEVGGRSTLHGGKVASCGPSERDRATTVVAATPAWDWVQRATVGKVPLMPEGWPRAKERKSKAGRGACSCVSDSQGSRNRRAKCPSARLLQRPRHLGPALGLRSKEREWKWRKNTACLEEQFIVVCAMEPSVQGSGNHHPPTHPPIYPSIYPYIHQSTHPSICPSMHPFFRPPIHLPIYHPCIPSPVGQGGVEPPHPCSLPDLLPGHQESPRRGLSTSRAGRRSQAKGTDGGN